MVPKSRASLILPQSFFCLSPEHISRFHQLENKLFKVHDRWCQTASQHLLKKTNVTLVKTLGYSKGTLTFNYLGLPLKTHNYHGSSGMGKALHQRNNCQNMSKRVISVKICPKAAADFFKGQQQWYLKDSKSCFLLDDLQNPSLMPSVP